MRNILYTVAGFVLILLSSEVKAEINSEYFIGQWSVLVEGTPNGDVTMNIILKRNEGKLEGTISTEGMESTKFDNIEEEGNSITLYWIAGEYNVRMYLEKVDENKLTGNMMDMFEATGERILKEKMEESPQDSADIFTGQWHTLVEGTPNGDVNMKIILERKEGKLEGIIRVETEGMEPTKFDNIEETDNSITLYWIAGEHNVRMYLEKVDENNLTGNMMDMFEASSVRIIEK